MSLISRGRLWNDEAVCYESPSLMCVCVCVEGRRREGEGRSIIIINLAPPLFGVLP